MNRMSYELENNPETIIEILYQSSNLYLQWVCVFAINTFIQSPKSFG